MDTPAFSQFPQYRSHKIVRAAIIEAITPKPETNNVELVVSYPNAVAHDGSTDKVYVDKDWPEKRGAEVGSYFVVYSDGYTSFSPAEQFEEGYTLIPENAPDVPAVSGNGVSQEQGQLLDEISVGLKALENHISLAAHQTAQEASDKLSTLISNLRATIGR